MTIINIIAIIITYDYNKHQNIITIIAITFKMMTVTIISLSSPSHHLVFSDLISTLRSGSWDFTTGATGSTLMPCVDKGLESALMEPISLAAAVVVAVMVVVVRSKAVVSMIFSLSPA